MVLVSVVRVSVSRWGVWVFVVIVIFLGGCLGFGVLSVV